MADFLERIEAAALDLGRSVDGDLPDAPDLDLPEAPDLSLPDALDIDLVYLAVGASDALGIGATPITNGYVFRIEDALDDRDTNVQLVNAAVPDATTDTITDAVQLALQTGVEPDLVTIWVGANDLTDAVDPADFEQELHNLLEELDGSGATVAIADLPDLTQLPRFREDPSPNVTAERIEAFNQAIANEAAEHGAVLVQLSDELVDERLVSEDGFHPNDAGHAAIAEQFLTAIEPALAGSDAAVATASDLDLFA
jgi:acyl-CoA thioesterase I